MLLTGALIFGVPVYMCLIREIKCDAYEEEYPDIGDIDKLFPSEKQSGNRITNYNSQTTPNCNSQTENYNDASSHIAAERRRPILHRPRPRIIRIPARRPIILPRPACSPIIINPREKRPHPVPLLSPVTHFVYAFLKAFLSPTECDEY